jgi:hypothetical protein
VFAVAGFFLTPFVLIFLTMYFFLRYGEELRNRPSFTLAARNWSRSARWRLWEYNELPHLLHNVPLPPPTPPPNIPPEPGLTSAANRNCAHSGCRRRRTRRKSTWRTSSRTR